MAIVSPTTFYEALKSALVAAANYNAVDQSAPVAVLWPDKERLWEALIPRVQAELPILILGDYNPSKRTGPAVWMRCMVDRTLPDADWPESSTPILYLPGLSKQELRAVEETPRVLQPLSEMQYRGILWTQKNGKDWTISAFLQSADKGLGIEITGNGVTREAMHRALAKLADEPVEELRKDAPLTAVRFNSLLHPDPVKSLLHWMNDPSKFHASQDAAAWSAFRAECKHQYNIDPDTDGEITAAGHLGGRQNVWGGVWNRYSEAPLRYPNIPDLLRRAKPAVPDSLFYQPSSWPQENEAKEALIRNSLLEMAGKPGNQVRTILAALEAVHAERRRWVWAELGLSPLAGVLPALLALGEATTTDLVGVTPDDIAAKYVEKGFQADVSALEALAGVSSIDDVPAVTAVVRTLYQPWLETGAEAFQRAVTDHPIAPSTGVGTVPACVTGQCLLFADGLRYDVGRKLSDTLVRQGLSSKIEWRYAALPSVTPTAKPAVSPVAEKLGPGNEFNTVVKSNGTKVTADILRRELGTAGYPAVSSDGIGNPATSGWTESGSIDAYGHAQGWKVARRVEEEIAELCDRIQALITGGWREIKVITDHGWLLLPGGLPDAELPLHLTEARKGRCARLKASAAFSGQTVPWHWDSTVRIAVAPGIRSYISGKEYEHGGLSPQECVVPVLTVTAQATESTAIEIQDIRWTGLRCRIQVSGIAPGLAVDVRSKAASKDSSLTAEPKAVRDAQASIIVTDDSQEGNAAFVVVLDQDGNLLAQRHTTVGG